MTRSGDGDELSTAAIVGIAIGATALFVIAIILFVIYWYRQKRYEREDNRMADHSRIYGKDPGSGSDSYMVDLRSASSGYSGPQYTRDHKSPPPPSYAPPAAGQSFEMDYTNNAEYYDRLEGKTRGRPLGTSAAAMAAAAERAKAGSVEDFNSADHVDTTALPAHPAYIPRDRMVPSRLGSRASYNSSPSIRSEPRFTKPDPYTIQVYMNGVDDAKNNAAAAQAPPSQEPSGHRPDGINRDVGITRDVGINREASVRSIQIELAGPPELSTSAPRPSISDSLATLRQGGGRATPIPPQGTGRVTPIPPQGGRTTPIPRASSSAQGSIDGGLRHGTPAPVHPSVSSSLSSSSSSPDNDTSGGPPRIPSLILPSIPRIRFPNKKPPKLIITGASPPDITGPLAFPDSRFSTRPPPPPGQGQAQGQDRIVEQTVDRGGRSMETAIGSGKSYLYG